MNSLERFVPGDLIRATRRCNSLRTEPRFGEEDDGNHNPIRWVDVNTDDLFLIVAIGCRFDNVIGRWHLLVHCSTGRCGWHTGDLSSRQAVFKHVNDDR